MKKVFIDGSVGTTGLRIRERLSGRQDIELVNLSEKYRKDIEARREALNVADISFLCLPDNAAVEAVSLIENDKTTVIDTSTAHRTSDDWTYGFAELSESHRRGIAASKRIANPGCHASGFIACVYPLVKHGIISTENHLCAFSLTGYSGGGKTLIAEYEDDNRDIRHESHRIYGTNLTHKHLPEMVKVCSLDVPPVFSPVLGDFYSGMATSVMLPGISAKIVHECIGEHYTGQKLVSVSPIGGDEGVIYASTYSGRDSMRIIVCGHENQTTVTALFDNLGKGASGAAIQNMNISLGVEETLGLVL